ncbi:hypothetical protein H5410_031514 [Solanum commersonii]|uniref:Protein FAR1-RELATED SEQUENCE n=1 Tax=Solanum commersonii TaxID=4109 RepID=A0A9J5YKE5_SOLCO|nr:hypothetical protein H5410_031514 [Solanum commersonii]
MDPNSQHSQLTQVLNNVLGLIKDDSLLSQNDEHDQDSDSGYDDRPEAYLHSDDEGARAIKSVSDGEEYEVDDEWDEDKDTTNDDNLSDQQYIESPIVGGPNRMGCTSKDCRNYILQQRRMRTLVSNTVAIQIFFASMQMKDDESFYVIDTDNFARLRNVVWVHTHCKYAYPKFSDVVCFNTTYMSILLGSTLLTSEDIKTYKFVFSTWLAAMGNVPPTATSLINHYFWAGMMSTQRAESMHAFFDDYFNGRSSLKQFVEQYEIALRFKYEKELQAKADSRKTHAAPSSGFDWDI